jgi:RNA polymerase sigma-70 factor (ECF subfamily)
MPLLKIRTVEQENASDDVRTDAAERAWVDRIRAGDMDAFETLYRTYWQRLYTFAFRYVGSKEEAEDVAQEVF